ncbi:helix-turn-helix domain-containing protein [Alloiococcus sp. CFN-8]|uniref:helix-turn-helix domain-containing protein n=1 Tax=Alloiococcus sp. CFN-8 TaxID=3416081 RepID=UPI003CEAFEA8
MMFKILIIEEDARVKELIKSFLLKHKDFNVMDSFAYTENPMERIINLQPDAIFLNYKIMDAYGDKLVEYIGINMSSMKVIVILDSPNFHQAQRAINQWRVDSIMERSQINEEILEGELASFFKTVKTNRLNNISHKELVEKYNEVALYILHEEVVSGGNEKRIGNAERKLGVKLDFKTEEFYLGYSGYDSSIYSHYTLGADTFNSFFHSLRSKIRSISSKNYKAEIFIHSTSKKFILIVSKKHHGKSDESVDKIFEQIHKLIQFEFQAKISGGLKEHQNFTTVSERLSGLGTHISNSFQKLIWCSDLAFFIAEKGIVRQEDIESLQKSSTLENINYMLENIKGALYSRDSSKLDYSIKVLFNEGLKYSFNRLLYSYSMDYLKEIYISAAMDNDFLSNLDFEKIISNGEYTTIEKTCGCICKLFSDLQEELMSKNCHKRIIIHDAVEYIKQNYDCRLTLKEISEYVCISPSYLSRIFKQKTGNSLNNFINAIRVEKAKALLDNTDYKVCEVCEKSGFLSAKYFSQVFKKLEGMTPMEYKVKAEKVG